MLFRSARVAIAAVGAVAASGLLITSVHVPDAASLAGSAYGQTLLAQSALVVDALVLGGWHSWQARRSALPAGGALGSLRAEAGLTLLAVLASGLLTSLPPASVAQATGPTVVTQAAHAGDVDLEVAVTPARPGVNLFDVRLARRGAPVAPSGEVHVLVRRADEDLQLRRHAFGNADATLRFNRQASVLPASEAAIHTDDVGIAHLLQVIRSKR